ncbi:hypothetical protein AB1Y20_005967 [Prymnesium parvum]|uniref:Uncharacterized protein n=1 Tax=Prymnesium parvum TaxID=97485 RepID=A0AB34J1A7_PRYPA
MAAKGEKKRVPPACYAEAEARLEALVGHIKEAARSTVVLDPAHAHAEAVKAAASLAQAARSFYFLVADGAASEKDASTCTADLEKAADVYASWARGLLACVGLPARKLMLAQVCACVKSTARLLSKAAGGAVEAPDAGMVETAAQKLKALELDAARAAVRLLEQAFQLIDDALAELKEAVEAEAGEEGEEGEGEESSSLLAAPVASKPLLRLVSAVHALVQQSAKEAVAGCGENDKAMMILITCAHAGSEQIDSLACAAYDGDGAGAAGYAASLTQLGSKMCMIMSRDAGLAEERVVSSKAELEACLAEFQAATTQPTRSYSKEESV